MIRNTISPKTARRFYDWLGARHDIGERYERAAKAQALAMLDLQPGLRVLNVGCGTGKEQKIIQDGIGDGAVSWGVDISWMMLNLTRERVTGTAVTQAWGDKLPFAQNSFDRLFCAYVLDLIALAAIPGWLDEFRRVLRPHGRLVLVSLTDGVSLNSKLVIGLWKGLYKIHPLICGGCRPLQLTDIVNDAGFVGVTREIVVQKGVASEILSARAA